MSNWYRGQWNWAAKVKMILTVGGLLNINWTKCFIVNLESVEFQAFSKWTFSCNPGLNRIILFQALKFIFEAVPIISTSKFFCYKISKLDSNPTYTKRELIGILTKW